MQILYYVKTRSLMKIAKVVEEMDGVLENRSDHSINTAPYFQLLSQPALEALVRKKLIKAHLDHKLSIQYLYAHMFPDTRKIFL